MRIVVGDIVVNPSEVRIRFLWRARGLQVLQSTSDHAVAEQTWEQSDLQREPILRLSDVEDVTAVCRASCGGLVWVVESHMCGKWRHTLTLFILLHIFLCETELCALFDVEIDLMSDVCDDRRALYMVRVG